SIFRQRKTHLLIPAALKRPSLERSASSRSRGRRECRVLSCTRSPVGNGKKAHQHSRYRNRPNIGIPRAMVLTAASYSPRSSGLVSLRRRLIISIGLTPASGGQDHTTWPSAPHRTSDDALRPLHPVPNTRDDREAPLLRARDDLC